MWNKDFTFSFLFFFVFGYYHSICEDVPSTSRHNCLHKVFVQGQLTCLFKFIEGSYGLVVSRSYHTRRDAKLHKPCSVCVLKYRADCVLTPSKGWILVFSHTGLIQDCKSSWMLLNSICSFITYRKSVYFRHLNIVIYFIFGFQMETT